MAGKIEKEGGTAYIYIKISVYVSNLLLIYLGSVAMLPPPPKSENPDYVQCPHCQRRV